MEHGISDLIAGLGPVFGFLLFALVVAVMVAMFGVGAWGLVKGEKHPRMRRRPAPT